MPETQDGNQIEQDQIAQFERAYELRGGLCRLRSHKTLVIRTEAEFLPRITSRFPLK
jgi:hypothetical protein